VPKLQVAALGQGERGEMNTRFEDYEPEKRTLKGVIVKGLGLILLLSVLGFGAKVVLAPLWFASRAVDVAKQELDPAVLLKKYEWFKDAAANLGKHQANIAVYQSRVTEMKGDYEGVARKDWDRTDKEQMSLWHQEVAGVKAAFNSLAAEYNAQMAKINWRFCNRGMLPEGATEELPREFAAYINQ
jgi:hypothetical protein